MMLLVVRVVCGVIVVVVTGLGLLVAWARIRRPHGRHQVLGAPLLSPRGAPGYFTGSMVLAEEEAWLARPDGIIHIDANGDLDLESWEVPHGAEAGAIWPHQELWNGHTVGCLCPSGDHHWTACPEEEDWPDDDETPGPLPDMFPAGPVEQLAARPGVVDRALAFEAETPADSGWTRELLAELRDAPTVLDQPPPSRLADTGEIALASLRADYAAELRAQDDDAAEDISRRASAAAQFRLEINGL